MNLYFSHGICHYQYLLPMKVTVLAAKMTYTFHMGYAILPGHDQGKQQCPCFCCIFGLQWQQYCSSLEIRGCVNCCCWLRGVGSRCVLMSWQSALILSQPRSLPPSKNWAEAVEGQVEQLYQNCILIVLYFHIFVDGKTLLLMNNRNYQFDRNFHSLRMAI